MKIIGITCDNYKLKKFEEALDQKGLTDRETIPLTKGTMLIKVKVEDKQFDDKQEEIRRMCVKLEYGFKRSN